MKPDIQHQKSVQLAPREFGIESLPPFAEDESLRLTVEAHTPEVIGVIPTYMDVAIVVAVFLTFVLLNAIWSAPDTSLIGALRRALRGRHVEGLFLGVKVRPLGVGSATGEKGEQRAVLTRLARRLIELDSDLPMQAGSLMRISAANYGEFVARVQHCHKVDGDQPWYHVTLRLEKDQDQDTEKFFSFLTAPGPAAMLVFLCLLLGGAANSTRSVMNALMDPLTRVLELSFDREEFAAEKNRPKIEAQLSQLAQAAARLEEHASGRERGFEFVAAALARDVRNELRAYKRGEFEEARRILHNLTDTCIACHASLPEQRKYPKPERFFGILRTKQLSPLALAHYQLVTRQFDEAMTTLEALLGAPGAEQSLTSLLAYFSDYMQVAIAVQHDFERPKKLLNSLLARPSLPISLRRLFETWQQALTDIRKISNFDKPSLEAARRLMNDGRSLMDTVSDRSALVHFVAAESMLQRFVQTQPDRGELVGEAYFWLGNSVSLSEHSRWLTRADFYYESAIRMAPGSNYAPRAFAALEERLYGEAHSRGGGLDTDALFLLDELSGLIEEAYARQRKI